MATSFIDELSRLDLSNFDLSVFVSSEVASNLASIETNKEFFDFFDTFDTYGLNVLLPSNSKRFAGFDLVFTVFGPDYNLFARYIKLVGFAQAWILFPNNEQYKLLPWYSRVTFRSKFFLQKLFFKSSDALIVELEHVRERLVALNVKAADVIHVVRNCCSNVFLDERKWREIKVARGKNFALGFVGRDYVHKNTKILPEIKKILMAKYQLEVDFFVTFTDSEWQAKGSEFRQLINNVGSLSMAECPPFYKAMDAVVFPSLLECFSATPLEAMVMKKPLFASDRGFVRDVCGDYAWYFDPNDPASAADLIYKYISSARDDNRLDSARAHAIEFSDAEVRASDYISVMKRFFDV